MKQLLTIVAIILSTVAMAQPPMQRPLPNQFRDFVDHQQAWEKPNIVRKDGKVIITMTEQQFRAMQHRRMQMRRNIPGRSPQSCLCHPPIRRLPNNKQLLKKF
jgi:hypothetical protein